MFDEELSVDRKLMHLIYQGKLSQLKSSYLAALPPERVLFLHRCFENESDGLLIVLTSALDQGKLTDIVRWLLNEGITYEIPFTHQPILGIATFSNSNELLQLVLECGFAVPNLCRGRTAKVIDANLQSLFDADWNVMEEEAEIWTIATNSVTNCAPLLSHGFDSLSPNAAKQFDNPRPPLFLAAISVKLPLIQLLLDRCVDINTRDRRGRTVLMETVNLEIVKFFINNGIDVDAQDKDGLSTLMHCAKVYRPWFADVDIIELLLEHGARIDLKDNFGDTVFDFVKSSQKRPMKLLLQRHVAKINEHLVVDAVTVAEEEQAGSEEGEGSPLKPDLSVVVR